MAAIGAHAVGGAGLIASNRRRVQQQDGAGANTGIKLGLTVAAAGLTAYSGVLGKQVEDQSHEGGAGATEPHAGASEKLQKAQQQLRVVQWAIPAVTGCPDRDGGPAGRAAASLPAAGHPPGLTEERRAVALIASGRRQPVGTRRGYGASRTTVQSSPGSPAPAGPVPERR